MGLRGRTCAFAALAAVLSLGAGGASTASAEGSYRVIVNAANPVTVMTRTVLAECYLGLGRTWPSGETVVALDQSTKTAVRTAFSEGVLRLTVEGVQTHWMKEIMAGRGRPPFVVSEAEVIARVSKNRHAVGYVAAETALPAEVKAIELKD